MADGNALDDDLTPDSVVYQTLGGAAYDFVLPPSGFSTELQRTWAEKISREVVGLRRDNRILRSQVDNTALLAKTATDSVGNLTQVINEANVEPLNAPSEPDVTSRLGSLEVRWDGTDFDGAPMGKGLAHINVYAVKTSDLPVSPNYDLNEIYSNDVLPEEAEPMARTIWPPLPIGTISSNADGSVLVLTDLEYNTEYTLWFIAVDVKGTRSLASEVVAVEVKPLVNTDIIGRIIDGVNITLGSIDETLFDANFQQKITDIEDGIEEAQTSADGKNNVWYRPTTNEPTGPHVVGDTWFVTNQNNKIMQWSGTAWVDVLIGSLALSDSAITAAKLANNAVTAANMVTGTITAASGIIADAAIGSAKIIDGAITTAKIGDAQITNAKIANLDAAKITTGSLAAARIAANAITTAKIATGAVTANEIAGLTITGDKIAANTITAAKIAALTITADEIAANAVTSAKIQADAINGKTITGATVRTAASGPRMQFDVNGLRGFNASDVETVRLRVNGDGLELTQDADYAKAILGLSANKTFGALISALSQTQNASFSLSAEGNAAALTIGSTAGPGGGSSVVIAADGNQNWVRSDSYRNGTGALSAPYASAGGVVPKQATAPAAATSVTVTFPPSRFTVPPIVTTSLWGAAKDCAVNVDEITSTSCKIWLGSNSTASRTFGAQWQAVQMLATSASG